MRTEINYKEKREALVKELKERLNDAEMAKYSPVLYQCECIIEELKALREEELDAIIDNK